MGYRVAEASEVARYEDAPLDEAHLKLLRQALGVRSFGVNQYDMPPNSTDYHEHDETSTNHEELYVCLGGSGTVIVDGENVEIRPGRYVLVDPESNRTVHAGPDGVSLLIIGGPVDRDFGGWPGL
jgi:uncharacterized cupin superfamily protein